MNYKQYIMLLKEEGDTPPEDRYFIQLNILEFLKLLNQEKVEIDKFYSLEKNTESLNISLDNPVIIYLTQLPEEFNKNEKETTSTFSSEEDGVLSTGEEETPSYDQDIPAKTPISLDQLKDAISTIEVDERFYPVVSNSLNNDEISEEQLVGYLQLETDLSRKEIQYSIKNFINKQLESYKFDATFK